MNNKYEQNVNKRYLFSYLIVSIIPIVLLSFVYLYTSIVKMKDSIDEAMLDKLDLIKNSIDLSIKNMESSSMHFSSNLKLIDEYKSKGINEISPQLNSYRENYPFADEVLFFIRGNNSIFTADHVMPYYEFQQELGDEVNLDMTKFYTYLYSSIKSCLIPTKLSSPYSLNTGKYMAYIHPVPLLDTQPQGTLAFLIDKQKFGDVIFNYMGDFKGYVCIFDSSMNNIYGYSTGLEVSPGIESQIYKLRGVGISNHVTGGRKYVSVRTVSENLGYSYTLFMSYKEFYASIWTELNFFSLVSTAIIILAAILAVIITLKTSAPIKKLINDMLPQSDNKKDGTFGDEADVFERICYEYKNVLTRNNELLLQVGSQRSLVRDQLLTRLLRGSFTNKDNIDLNMKCANISFDYSSFFALYIKLNEKSNHSPDMIADYLDKIYFKNGKAYGVELEDGSGLALIVNASFSGNETEENILKNTVVMFKNMLTQYGFTDLLIGVGGIHQDIMDIDMSFIEAEKAINEGHWIENIYLYSPSVRTDKMCYIQPSAEKAIFYQSLVKGNADAAVATLNKMFHGMECHAYSFVRVRSFCFYISNTIAEAASIIGFDIPGNEVGKSAAFSSLEEFRQCAVDITMDICRYALQKQEEKSEQLKNVIIDYVAANFSDYDISIDKLAQKFRLSQSYLGKFFKNETGYSFLQYITMLRMEYIKQKLVTTDISIKEIVQSSGYADTANFIRKFKAAEGMTPGQFREMSSKLKHPEVGSV